MDKELKQLVRISKKGNILLDKSNKAILLAVKVNIATVIVNVITILAIVWAVLK